MRKDHVCLDCPKNRSSTASIDRCERCSARATWARSSSSDISDSPSGGEDAVEVVSAVMEGGRGRMLDVNTEELEGMGLDDARDASDWGESTSRSISSPGFV